jgi:hypothetical protein
MPAVLVLCIASAGEGSSYIQFGHLWTSLAACIPVVDRN